jgi:hypothetical protein
MILVMLKKWGHRIIVGLMSGLLKSLHFLLSLQNCIINWISLKIVNILRIKITCKIIQLENMKSHRIRL